MRIYTGRPLTSIPLPPFTLQDPTFDLFENDCTYPSLVIPSTYKTLTEELFPNYPVSSAVIHVFMNAHTLNLIQSPHPPQSLTYFVNHTLDSSLNVVPKIKRASKLFVNYETATYILDTDINPKNPPDQILSPTSRPLALPPVPPIPKQPVFVQHYSGPDTPFISLLIPQIYLAQYEPLFPFLHSKTIMTPKITLALDYAVQCLNQNRGANQ